MKNDNCALILGGYVNGYSIIQELHEKGVQNLILFDTSNKAASFSNKIQNFFLIGPTSEDLFKALEKLHEDYEKIVIFPTDDLQLENLFEIYEKISSFCFVPFNPDNFQTCLKKTNQYHYCKILGIPCPNTVEINSVEDIQKVSSLQLPIIIKPNKRDDLRIRIFRNIILYTQDDVEKNSEILKKFILSGITFLASEIIPGEGSNIYAYVGYRNKTGVILNEWTGKKLSQYPDDFGVFASASNQAPEEISHQGRVLMEGMNLFGIAEPEFKYDSRDGKYKLMEINLRSMMWNRVGNLSGVNIQYSQYQDATGGYIQKQEQVKMKQIHYVYLKHEISNLLTRKNYYKIFVKNIFESDETHLAFFDIRDPIPFLIDISDTIKMSGLICLRALKIL